MSKKEETMMSLVEFVELFLNLPEEKQKALEEFLQASENDNGVMGALDNISNEQVRNEFKSTLIANGLIA